MGWFLKLNTPLAIETQELRFGYVGIVILFLVMQFGVVVPTPLATEPQELLRFGLVGIVILLRVVQFRVLVPTPLAIEPKNFFVLAS